MLDRGYLLSLCKCDECPLRSIRRPVFGEGIAKGGLVLVGEAPGKNEYIAGRPFTGQAGKLLDATLEAVGVSRADVFVTNTVACRPATEGARDIPPPKEAIAACKPRLAAELANQEAKLVVTLGSVASSSMLGSREKISDLVGSLFWSNDFSAWIMPTYHPAAVLHGSLGIFDDILGVLKRASLIASGKLPTPPIDLQIDYTFITDPAIAYELLKGMLSRSKLEFALDIETDNLRYLENDLLLVSMSGNIEGKVSDNNISIVSGFNYVFHPQALGQEPANMLFVQMLEDPAITWYIHNLSFDFQFLRYHYGAVPVNAVDTMAMALGTTERGIGVGLKRLAREYLGAPFYEQKLQPYLRRKDLHYSDIPIADLIQYAAYDTYYTVRLPDALNPVIAEEGASDLVNKILIPAQRLFSELEYTGVLIDQEWARSLEALWLPQILDAQEKLADYAESRGFNAYRITKAPKTGGRLNPNSSKQLLYFFYDLLGYEAPEDKKHGKYTVSKPTTNTDFISENENDEPVKLLRRYRQLSKLLKTYVYGILDDVWIDGRVHPSIKLTAAVTGRLGIVNPPLQTIPHYGLTGENTETLANQIRGIFIATPGYTFVEADYKGLELHIAWHYSKDENLAHAIMSGDFHSATASAMLHKPLSEVTKADRVKAKKVAFGVMYGRGAQSLATGELNCSVEEAQYYIDQFWLAYPKYAQWIKSIHAFVAKYGYVKSSLGRKRRWSLITRDTIGQIQNQAVNMPIQSLASDLCLTSAIQLQKLVTQKDYGRVLFLVHDSIVFEIRQGCEQQAYKIINEVMTNPIFPSCAQFDIEIAAGTKWSNVKAVEV
jgi:uracil-DNA glycosylase family 4